MRRGLVNNEFNTSGFLDELDAFGRPPPQQKLFSGDDRAQDFAWKLDKINIHKQQKIKGEMLLPSNSGMVRLGNEDRVKQARTKIDTHDVQSWRNDVLESNRPKNQSYHSPSSVDSAREYARKLAGSDGGLQQLQVHCKGDDNSDSDEGRITDSSSNLHPSPYASESLRDVVVVASHARKNSDYSSASSQKSTSPFEGPASTAVGGGVRPTTERASPAYADYSSLYKTSASTIDEGGRMNPIKSFNVMFRGAAGTNSTSSINSSSTANGFNSNSKPRAEKSLADLVRKPNVKSNVRTTPEVRVPHEKPPAGKPPTFKPVNDQRTAMWADMARTMHTQDDRMNALTDRLRQDLVLDKTAIVGRCANCREVITDREERFSINESMYHNDCFACEVCNRKLNPDEFLLDGDRLFCKQDYLFKFERHVARCAACREPLRDTVLTALNRSYHPACFQCTACGLCLDGVPFALKENQPFCMPDYHDRFAPRCAACKKPILPENDGGETVRIVAMDRDYHLDCYSCENCGLGLSDESRPCYPLRGRLYCEPCHVICAKRAINSPLPITDL